jgi:hypothetical protein
MDKQKWRGGQRRANSLIIKGVKKVANNSSLLSKLLSFKRDESGMTIILIAILLPVLISAVNLSVLTQGTNFSIFFS